MFSDLYLALNQVKIGTRDLDNCRLIESLSIDDFKSGKKRENVRESLY